jgi:uncharacterized protein (TIGR03086 family)
MIDLEPACQTMIDLLTGISDDQLTHPTPCTEYTVANLVDHVDDLAQGFVAIARKDTGDPGRTSREPATTKIGDVRRTGVAEQVRLLGEAWDDPAAWQGTTAADADLALPNEVWGKIAFTEIVVHGWDIAQATGRPFVLPEETLRACLDHVAQFVPNAPVPELWGPAVETPDDAPLINRIVAITGRNPRWNDSDAIREGAVSM